MAENLDSRGSIKARDIVLSASGRLLSKPGSDEKLCSLPVPVQSSAPAGWQWIAVPDWAQDLVPAGKQGFYMPRFGEKRDWDGYDWWRGAEYLVSSRYERDHEQRHGPIHSYSSRLSSEFLPVLEHAWVNRVVLFLRRWWAVRQKAREEEAFGALPKPLLYLTHDVDAVSKTVMTRTKQTVFSLYNRQLGKAARYLLNPADYWQFDTILAIEERFGRTSHWNMYGGRGGWRRSGKEILMDPSYDVGEDRLTHQIRSMSSNGHWIGLHPRYDTWQDESRMRVEKEKIERALEREITEVRQHWLRFSFKDTWKCQAAAGLKHDMTLGFNDRTGFRNGAALSYIDAESGIRVTPMVMMDSHLYDYSALSDEKRFGKIDRMLDELSQTGGVASVIWHQRVFHSDYGWGPTYEYLLAQMNARNFMSVPQ